MSIHRHSNPLDTYEPPPWKRPLSHAKISHASPILFHIYHGSWKSPLTSFFLILHDHTIYFNILEDISFPVKVPTTPLQLHRYSPPYVFCSMINRQIMSLGQWYISLVLRRLVCRGGNASPRCSRATRSWKLVRHDSDYPVTLYHVLRQIPSYI